MKSKKCPTLSKKVSDTAILIPASIGLKTVLTDARPYPGQRKQLFGSLNTLAKQHGVTITKVEEEFRLSGSRDSLSSIIFFIHHSGTPYRLATTSK